MKNIFLIIVIILFASCTNQPKKTNVDDGEYIDSLISNNLFDSNVVMVMDSTTSMIGK
ncbi:MAG: hypothetical protein RIR48_790 [Bacteroidota bacterium]